MKNKFWIIAGVIMFALIAGWFTEIFAEKGYTSISPQEARKVIENEKELLILDVRTPREFDGPLGHLDGAMLMPVQKLQQRIGELESYKDKKILVVCRTGGRSKAASKILARNGFKNITEIRTGMIGMNEVTHAPK